MFSPISDVLSGKLTDKVVSLRGWVYRRREQKELVFLVLRDSSGVIQVTCKGLKEAEKATIESSVEIVGTVKRDERAPDGYEIHAKSIKIVGLAERFPITRDLSEEFKRDVRHLWVRSEDISHALKIRSAVFDAIHDYFRKQGYYEVQSPSIVTAAVEGGSTLFEMKYFDKKAYLTQSWQLHAEALMYSLEKIYTIAPSFRAEKSRTIRHLAEYWHAEAELAWADADEMMKVVEELVSYAAQHVAKTCAKSLEHFKVDAKQLLLIKSPFERISYDDAIKALQKKGFKIKWGEDMGADEEKALMEGKEKPVFVVGYPRKVKAFYHMPDPKRTEITRSFDLLAPGVGEIVGGGQRIHDKKQLLESLKLFKLDPKDYEWYIDLRRYGTVPHSGFGLGIERLIMYLAKIPHILDTIPFPRTYYRSTP